MIKLAKYFIQSLFVYFFFIIGRLIGLSQSRRVFSFLFKKVGQNFKSQKIIEKNLNIFNSSLSPEEKRNIVENMWSNYGMTFIEYIYLSKFRNSNNFVDIKGEEILLNVIRNNEPVVFISGHFSNFELMSMEITKKNIKLATIYRPLNNYFLNPFMEYLRKKYVCANQIKKGLNGVRESIDYIRKGFSIALMIDQRVSEGEKINFFGKPALTTTLPAQLALKFKLPIIPVFIERTDKKKFKITFQKEIKPSDFRNKFDLSVKLSQTLESMIVKKPDEWIWTHNRWK